MYGQEQELFQYLSARADGRQEGREVGFYEMVLSELSEAVLQGRDSRA